MKRQFQENKVQKQTNWRYNQRQQDKQLQTKQMKKYGKRQARQDRKEEERIKQMIHENPQSQEDIQEEITMSQQIKEWIDSYEDWGFTRQIVAHCLVIANYVIDDTENLILEADIHEDPVQKQMRKKQRQLKLKKVSQIQQRNPMSSRLQRNTTHKRIIKQEPINNQENKYNNWTFKQTRKYTEELFHQREQILTLCSNIANKKSKEQLQRRANKLTPFINQLSQASVLKLVKNTFIKNPPFSIDLHGFRTQEIDYVLTIIVNAIKDQLKNRQQNQEQRLLRISAQDYFLKIITGQGNHSQNGKSRLKIQIKNWFNNKKIKVKQDINILLLQISK